MAAVGYPAGLYDALLEGCRAPFTSGLFWTGHGPNLHVHKGAPNPQPAPLRALVLLWALLQEGCRVENETGTQSPVKCGWVGVGRRQGAANGSHKVWAGVEDGEGEGKRP